MKASVDFGVTILALFALGCIVGHCTGCKPAEVPKNVENGAAVVQYERLLDGCRVQGRAAKSYDVYERCADEVDRRLCLSTGVRCLGGGR